MRPVAGSCTQAPASPDSNWTATPTSPTPPSPPNSPDGPHHPQHLTPTASQTHMESKKIASHCGYLVPHRRLRLLKLVTVASRLCYVSLISGSSVNAGGMALTDEIHVHAADPEVSEGPGDDRLADPLAALDPLAAAWPRSPANIHGLLDARHHLLEAGDAGRACDLTGIVCAQLHAWGDLDGEAALASDMLRRLPESSVRRASLLYVLGKTAQVQQDYAAAERSYEEALQVFETAGDGQGVSRCHHGLATLAQARGEYAHAELSYEQAEHAALPDAEQPTGHESAAPLPAPAALAPAIAAPAPAPAPQRRSSRRWRLTILAAIAMAMVVLAAIQLVVALTSTVRIHQPPDAGRQAAPSPHSAGTTPDGSAVRRGTVAPNDTAVPDGITRPNSITAPHDTAVPISITAPHDTPVPSATTPAAQPTGECPGKGRHRGWQHSHQTACGVGQPPSHPGDPLPSASVPGSPSSA
jgi:Tetratricopeptide repeat